MKIDIMEIYECIVGRARDTSGISQAEKFCL